MPAMEDRTPREIQSEPNNSEVNVANNQRKPNPADEGQQQQQKLLKK